MAYNLTSRVFAIASDTTDANGVRWVTLQVTETYTNDQAPFDSYQVVPAERTITTSPGHGSSAVCAFREVIEPYRSSGSLWPNPFTVRSVGLGSMNFNTVATPANILLTSTSSGAYEFEPAPDNMLEENFAAFENIQNLELADKDELVDEAHLNEGLN